MPPTSQESNSSLRWRPHSVPGAGGTHVASIAVGTAISVCNIAIHALVMATAVHMSSRIAGAKDTVWQSRRSTTVMIAIVSIATVPVLMVAHFLEVMVWSLAYAIVGAAPAGADPVYFAFVNYTTLGYIDLEMDKSDEAAGRKIECPLHVLWGGKGTVGALWDMLATWREKCAAPVTGRALDCGHFLQEEKPDELLTELRQFLS
jgi:pimeloyl-ACP methyl ester carboxylesterase